MNSIPIVGGPLDGTESYYRTRKPRYLAETGETMGTVKGDRMAWQWQLEPDKANRSGYVLMRVTGIDAYVHTSVLKNYISHGES